MASLPACNFQGPVNPGTRRLHLLCAMRSSTRLAQIVAVLPAGIVWVMAAVIAEGKALADENAA